MSQNRQIVHGSQAPPLPVPAMRSLAVGVAFDFDAAVTLEPHRHDAGQLIYAADGTMTVATESGTWVVPVNRGVWVPPNAAHSIRTAGPLAMRTVYVETNAAGRFASDPYVLGVSPLLRELVLTVVDRAEQKSTERDARLEAVLFDQIETAGDQPLCLPMPSDPRARRVADAFVDDPSERRTLAEWARFAGAGERTLARLFAKETGMTFGRWCLQARLMAAVELLGSGRSVIATAVEVGYDSPSAFVQAFSRVLGTTPARFVRLSRDSGPV